MLRSKAEDVIDGPLVVDERAVMSGDDLGVGFARARLMSR
jgi:hypothetical protein